MLSDSYGANHALEAVMDLIWRIRRRNAASLFRVFIAVILPWNAVVYMKNGIPVPIMDAFEGNLFLVALMASLIALAVVFLANVIFVNPRVDEPEWDEMLAITRKFPGIVNYLKDYDHPVVRDFLKYRNMRDGFGYVA